jgi:GntR family transcriptional regulator/MocR family aminotransferase
MDLAIALDNNASLPLHRQLYEELRRAILTGRLMPRQRIPSTRALAKSLGISRATVALSYEQLKSEGYLQTAYGSGTFVCAILPDDLLHSTSVESTRNASRSPLALSTYGASLNRKELIRVAKPDALISFRYGQPALDYFPLDVWRKLLSRHCRLSHDLLDYAADARGHEPLREAITSYLSRARAVQCGSDQVIIVNGSQQALDLIARLFIDRGDWVVLEDPGYLGARCAFLSQGAQPYPVAVDESGLMVKDLAHCPEPIKLVYVTPSHQFPTGAVLSLPRRLELLTWAQQAGAMIIEDDYDSEYRYVDRPIPALQGLEQSNCAIYVGTFSKVLFPSLRIGYLVVPPSLVEVFTHAKWLADRQCPLLEQHVLADFISEGHLERHIRRMRILYDQRRRALVEALMLHLGQQVTILGENAGIHLMVRLHTALSDEEVVHRAALFGVGLVPAQPYYLGVGRKGEFIFGYAELNESQIQEGICRLPQVLTD